MKWGLFSLFRMSSGIFPSKQGYKLLNEGYNALKHGDCVQATQIYNNMLPEDKKSKHVIGFYAAIETQKREKIYIDELKTRHNIK